MANQQNSYTGSQGTGTNNADFSFTFPSFTTSEVKVEVDNVVKTLTTHYTVENYNTTSGGKVRFTAGNIPTGTTPVRIFRQTDVDSAKATFTAGSSLKAGEINDNFKQLRHALQEAIGANATDRKVQEFNIEDGAVTTAKIKADNITSALIADDQINSEHYAADSIDSEHYAPGSVDTAAIGALQVTTNELATDSVNTSKIINLNVTRGKLENDAIDGTKLADDAVNSEHYVDGSIDHVHLANDIIDGDNIQDDVVNSEHIVAGALDNEHYAAGSITSDKLSDATVVTASEQNGFSVNDTSFFTTSAAEARYFNINTGDTIKDGQTFPDNDTSIATTAAINDRIIDLVDDVGGFVPIANETSFPTANPDVNNGSGTLVSIKSISSSRTPSNGSVSIANGSGSNTVTITGCGSTVLAAGFGVIVETTSTLHTYAFHRLVPKATEVTTVASNTTEIGTVHTNINNINTVAGISSDVTAVKNIASDVTAVKNIASNVTAVANDATDIGIVAADGTDIGLVAGSINNVNTVAGSITSVNNAQANLTSINNFGDKYQVASSNPSTDGGGNALAAGDLYFNTSANELKVYTGSQWQGGVTATGNFASVTGNTFTGSNTYNDNVKAQFGTSADGLEIYHTGLNSIINDNGTGSLFLQMGGSNKLWLTSNGVNVGGNLTLSGTVDGRDVAADGTKIDNAITSSGDLTVTNTDPSLTLTDTQSNAYAFLDGNAGSLNIHADKSNNNNNSSIGFAVDNSMKMTLTDDGYLGIGQTSPTSPLHIKTTVSDQRAQLKLETFQPKIRFQDLSTSARSGEIKVDGNAMRFNVGTPVDDTTDITEIMRIASSGRVGIGTNDPDTMLEISSNADTQTTATIPTVRLTNEDGAAEAADIMGSFEFFTKDTSDSDKITAFVRSMSLSNAGVNYDLAFGTKSTNTSGDATEKVRLTSDGKFLIGRTTGDFPLDVNGAARIAGKFYMGNDQRIEWGSSNVSYIVGNDNSHIAFGINTEKMRLTSTGLAVTGSITTTDGSITQANSGGTENSFGTNINISTIYPSIALNDTDSENDWKIQNQNGKFAIHDADRNTNVLTIEGRSGQSNYGEVGIFGDLVVDNGTSTLLNVKCDNAGNAIVRAGGDSQGTGAFEVSQDNGLHGGGISYNGDSTPAFVTGEQSDHITFYRLQAGNRHEVFHYPYNSGIVNFNSVPTVGGVSLVRTSDTIANATEAANVTAIANNSTNTSYRIPFLTAATGTAQLQTDSTTGPSYNPFLGRIFSGSFQGTLIGNVTGNVTGDLTGTASEATEVNTQATSTNATRYLTFVSSNTSSASAKTLFTMGGISVNPSTGVLSATSFAGDGSNLTGISAGAQGGGSDEVFWCNGQSVTSNFTIPNGKNAMSAGPITINNNVTVTVGAGETWTVV